MTIYHDLKLDKLDCTVAIIKNARSQKMGKKDIIKVECPIEDLDLDILGFIDHNITVNIIKDEKIVAKKELKLPKQVVNVIKCKNPRCITSIEQGRVRLLRRPEYRSGNRALCFHRKVFYKKATDILQNISAKYSCFYYVLIIIHSQTDKPGYVVG